MGKTVTQVSRVAEARISKWSRYPTIFEINAWAWISGLREKYGKRIDLASIPAAEWDSLASHGFNAIWLMGVWERSPRGIAISNQNQNLLADFKRALPDYRPEDNVGSPYCIRNYSVDPNLGGPAGLAAARRELAERGLKLVLDFVPNHVAPDHPWVNEHPEYFICGTSEDLAQDPVSFTRIGNTVFACGRDPYFPAWQDVLQLNAFHPALRAAALATIMDIARQCDGIRCDMAMLLLNEVFQRTWGSRAGHQPTTDYWTDVISASKKANPNFLFIAEAYWDLEWQLQQQGFDFCYDKKLYDRLEHSDAEKVRLHLCADHAYQDKLIRFLENHDEPRASATFQPEKGRVAAVIAVTLPGARLLHEGQFEGHKVRLPVFLARRPKESSDAELQVFYHKLLAAVDNPVFREGEWKLCERNGWPGNGSYQNILAWTWTRYEGRYLIVVNLSDGTSQARVKVDWNDVAERTWCLMDLPTGAAYDRDGNEMYSSGLYVELGPWRYHFFHCHPSNSK